MHKNITFYLPKDYDKEKLKINYNGLEQLSFKNKKGERIGTVSYYYDNKFISKDNVVLESKLEISINKIIRKYIYIIVGLPIIIVLFLKLYIKKRRVNE